MASPESEIRELIRRARDGEQEAMGELLEKHRPYLRVIAERGVDGRLAARVDPSDLIQQTCLSVHRNFDKFAGTEAGEFVAWLRKIHEQNIQNVVRDHAVAQKRGRSRWSTSTSRISRSSRMRISRG